MNDQELSRSERAASLLMRTFAVVGLVAVLALIAWLAVQGIRYLPRAGDGLGAAVNAVTSVFRTAPEESLSIALTERTVQVGDVATFGFEYQGDAINPVYNFSYECVDGVSFTVMGSRGWTDLACETPFVSNDAEVQVIPSATEKRFNQVTLSLSSGELSDDTLFTVINMEARDETSALDELVAELNEADEVAQEDVSNVPSEVVEDVQESATPAPAPNTPAVTPLQPAPTVPVARDPADLAVNIVETGVLVEVAGENTFFPVSPIPSDKVAAVRFTVTNQGEQSSGTWTFRAELPIEGDEDYVYTAPAQNAMLPGTQVEFTLGFDQISEDDEGRIEVFIIPTQSTDRSANNSDAVKIEIKN